MKQDGVIITSDEYGKVVETKTHQCVHCGGHFTSVKGSGVVRGFCRNCMGMVCSKECAECVPFMKKIEAMERA